MNDKVLLKKVRKALDARNVVEAERLLSLVKQQNAEYYYLHSEVDYLKNWTNECRKNLEKAIDLDPDNEQYRMTYDRIVSGAPPADIPDSSTAYPYGKKQMGSWKDGCAEACCECGCALCAEGLCEAICNGC